MWDTLRYCSTLKIKPLNKEALQNYSCSITHIGIFTYLVYSIKVSKSIFPTAIPLGFRPNNHFINSDSLGGT